ncbi:hypothetical protein ACFQFC_10555 [Amorphoplanes digitatis]|uniref:DUF4760 domain-containing protein n=1 Tax=Actinoplanes digitatis TaxID=1868 RepID=A0A7W7I1A0_9ACTN|nr:hypothetical protein [Actinoplanes digitatis]MBB4764638.1 hypothetical protein [Actinoplanes digitatis]BFE74166.1 hypothetical protein GCM10020092_074670 [Actinoplanes digitatis]GID91412.1 hypothetical protein Adi01nite_08240 [Actinoplanes digitatis]
MIFNVATLIVSVAALAISGWAAARQLRLVRGSSDLKLTAEILVGRFGSKEFQVDQRYVLERLGQDHDPALGIGGLPEPAAAAAWNVAFMYENLGLMLVFGLVDRRIVLSIGNYRIQRSWEALEPFIRAERSLRDAPFMNFFENAYVEACATSPGDIYRSLGLKETRSSSASAAAARSS